MAGVFELKNANGNKATLLFPDTSFSDIEVDLSGSDRIGLIDYGYVAKSYHIVAFGGEFNRADYPKLWSYLQANPSLVKTQAQWTTEATANYGMCGYFSSGNGTTTFRVPNLDKAFLRPDSRAVGSFQDGTLVAADTDASNDVFSLRTKAGGSILNDIQADTYMPSRFPNAFAAWTPAPNTWLITQTNYFGVARPKNIAVLPLIVAK